VSHSPGLVNEDANDRLVVRPSDFGVHQFKSVVDGHSLGNCSHTLFNRTRAHHALRKNHCPKEKVGANPPDHTAALRASRELYVKGRREANAQKAAFIAGKSREALLREKQNDPRKQTKFLELRIFSRCCL
jgi:hypothetical protein